MPNEIFMLQIRNAVLPKFPQHASVSTADNIWSHRSSTNDGKREGAEDKVYAIIAALFAIFQHFPLQCIYFDLFQHIFLLFLLLFSSYSFSLFSEAPCCSYILVNLLLLLLFPWLAVIVCQGDKQVVAILLDHTVNMLTMYSWTPPVYYAYGSCVLRLLKLPKTFY